MSDIKLSYNEISVLKLGLKHRILVRPKQDIYEQIIQQDSPKKDDISKHSLLHLKYT